MFLKFSKANAKIEALSQVPELEKYLQNKRKVYSLDLLSGWSCPYASECLSKVHDMGTHKKLLDGPDTKFRCFSASQEVLYSNLYNLRKFNFDLLRNKKTTLGKFHLIRESLPYNTGILRFHVGGDFFNKSYFDAAVKIAEYFSDRLFYAYTKSLPFWLEWSNLPENLVLTASRGGRFDSLISKHNLRESVVVYSEKEAFDKGLEIDHDDSHAANPAKRNESFALLIHGVQPKGSEASEALKKLKGVGSYARK